MLRIGVNGMNARNWEVPTFLMLSWAVAFCLGLCAAQFGQFRHLNDAAIFSDHNIIAERYSFDEGCQVFRLSRDGKFVGWVADNSAGQWNAAHLYPRWHYASPVLTLPQALASIGMTKEPQR